jgi:anti-sigma factor RsiW
MQEGGNAEILLDYCARKLSPAARATLDRHIEVCPACRRFRDQQQALWNALEAWEPDEASLGFDRRLAARFDEEDRRPAWAGWFAGVSLKPAIPLAAVLCLWVIGTRWFSAHPPKPAPPDPPAIVETLEVDQVETTLDDLEMLGQLK